MAGTNPRAARIAALIQRVVASSIERELHDKRLASITVTEVRVTNDLQIAKVYWTQLGHEGHEEGERKRAQQALDQAKGHLRSLVGHKAGLRLTPQLQFVFDEVPGEAHEIEDILAVAKKLDEELARARATAQYAVGSPLWPPSVSCADSVCQRERASPSTSTSPSASSVVVRRPRRMVAS